MPHLKESDDGNVINITSVAGVRPMGSSIAYSMTKAALNHLTLLLAKSCGPVRINAVAPGLVATPWTKDWQAHHENVKTIAGAVLTKVSGDCRISAPIAALGGDSAQHLKECFEIQLGSAFQCPGISYVSNVTKDSKGNKCRDMTEAHKGMNLRKADFDAFRDDLAASLSESKLKTEDVRSIAAFIEGTRNLVTQSNTQPDKNTFCKCPNGEFMGKSCVVEAGPIDAGTDASDAADAGDSG